MNLNDATIRFPLEKGVENVTDLSSNHRRMKNKKSHEFFPNWTTSMAAREFSSLFENTVTSKE